MSELGLEPDDDLRALEQRILAYDDVAAAVTRTHARAACAVARFASSSSPVDC